MNSGRISAGNNLTIDMTPERWRLLVNGGGTERVLVEAATGEPLRYMPTFGQRRRLPDSGELPTLYIQRVALGWSASDESWHLGLVLEPELANPRGSRWCEVAHWPDPARNVYVELARQAGNGLAGVVERPFDLIAPRDAQTAVPAPQPAFAPTERTTYPPTPYPYTAPSYAPPRPLPTLPLRLDEWQLTQQAADTLEFRRSGAWARGKRLRVLWYTLFIAIYLVLSITTLQGRIAMPKPEFLPYLGLVSAGILFVLALATIIRIGRTPNRLLVQAGHGITALRGRSRRWHLPQGDIEAVYVSQVVNRKVKRDKRTIHYAELSVLSRNGKFRRLVEHNQAEDLPVPESENGAAQEIVMPLTANDVQTNMQAAAAHVARTLNVVARYDQRLK